MRHPAALVGMGGVMENVNGKIIFKIQDVFINEVIFGERFSTHVV